MDNFELRDVPKEALQFSVAAECTFADNGTDSKTAPFKMVARTGEPLNHFLFGPLVHDMAGIKLNKPRLPIDYEHNEVIGYANHFDASTGDLIASGVIQSVTPNDRANEVIQRGRSGFPWEASIAHDNDILLEMVDEGIPVNVNNRELVGPLTIVREFTLRSIAVCKNGYDKLTSTVFNDNGDKVQIKIKRNIMEEKTLEGTELVVPVESETLEGVTELVAPVEGEQAPSVQAETCVTVIVETKASVEEEDKDEGETEEPTVVEPESIEVQPATYVPLKQEEMQAFTQQYDAKIYEFEALINTLRAENHELKTRLAAIRDRGEKSPVSIQAEIKKEDGQDMAKINEFAKKVGPNLSVFAANLKIKR